MFRGTTPTLIFAMPMDMANVSELCLAFSQNGRVIFEKRLKDFTISGNRLKLKLSEMDTLRLDSAKTWVEMQFRLKIEEDILASNIMRVEVKRILCDEVFNDF